jgi:hypothetical protein
MQQMVTLPRMPTAGAHRIQRPHVMIFRAADERDRHAQVTP